MAAYLYLMVISLVALRSFCVQFRRGNWCVRFFDETNQVDDDALSCGHFFFFHFELDVNSKHDLHIDMFM